MIRKILTAAAMTAILAGSSISANAYVGYVTANEYQYVVQIPDDIRKAAEYYAGMYGLSPELIEAVCFAESWYQKDLTDEGGCCGLMQVNPQVHEDLLDSKNITNIYDTCQNINIGCCVLYKDYEWCMGNGYGNDLPRILMMYNGDNTGLSEYDRTGTWSDYANKVMSLAYILENEHYNHALPKYEVRKD